MKSILDRVNKLLSLDNGLLNREKLKTLYSNAEDSLKTATSPSRFKNIINVLEKALVHHKMYMDEMISNNYQDVDVNEYLAIYTELSNYIKDFISKYEESHTQINWKSTDFDTWEKSPKVFD